MGDTLQWTYPDARNTNGTQVSVQSAPHPPCGQSLIPGKETGTQAVRPAGTFSRSEKAMPLTPASFLCSSEDRHLCRVG